MMADIVHSVDKHGGRFSEQLAGPGKAEIAGSVG